MQDGSGGSNNSSQKKEKEEEDKKNEVSCIVKFRPCENWTGEYGFDWFREKNDQYQERLGDLDEYFSEKPDRLLKERMVQAYMDEKYKKAQTNKGKEKYNYKKWHNQLCIDANNSEEGGDAYIEKALDKYIKKHDIKKDMYTWQYGDEENQNEMLDDVKNKIKNDYDYENEYQPFEYYYEPDSIFKVSYLVNRAVHGHVWTQNELILMDLNGVNVPWEHLDCRISGNDGTNLSLQTVSEGKFKVPIYYDTEENGRMPDASNYWSFNKKAFYKKTLAIYDRISGTQTVKKFSEWYLDGFLLNGDTTAFENPIEIRAKSIKFKNTAKDLSYKLRYLCIGGELHTVAEVGGYKCHYVDGKLNQINYKGTGWSLVQDLMEDEERKAYIDETNNAMEEMLTDDMKKNQNMSVEKLIRIREDGSIGRVDEGVLDHINVVLYMPASKKLYELKTEDGFTEQEDFSGKKHWFWGKHEIKSWEQEYFDSFLPENIVLQQKNNDSNDANTGEQNNSGENKPEGYPVPVLSITVSKLDRKAIRIRSRSDAPMKKSEQKDIYNLQLFVEGDYEKLYLEPEHSFVTVMKNGTELTEIDQSEGKKIEIQIKNNVTKDIINKLQDKYDYLPTFITVWAKEKGADNRKKVGKLNIRIYRGVKQTVMFVKVNLRGKALSKNFLDAMEDQKDSMRNAMLQAGIEPDIIDFDLTLRSSDTQCYRKGKNWYFNEYHDLGKYVLKQFLEENPLVQQYAIFVFCFDAPFASDINTGGGFYWLYKNHKLIFLNNRLTGNQRSNIQTLPHEIGHALGLPHSFQLYMETYEHEAFKNKFCFDFTTTNNIMDYSSLGFNFRKYQWDRMIGAQKKFNELAQKLNDKNKEQKKLQEKAMQELKESLAKVLEENAIDPSTLETSW